MNCLHLLCTFKELKALFGGLFNNIKITFLAFYVILSSKFRLHIRSLPRNVKLLGLLRPELHSLTGFDLLV